MTKSILNFTNKEKLGLLSRMPSQRSYISMRRLRLTLWQFPNYKQIPLNLRLWSFSLIDKATQSTIGHFPWVHPMVVEERTTQLIFVIPLVSSTVGTLKKTLIWRTRPKKESNRLVR